MRLHETARRSLRWLVTVAVGVIAALVTFLVLIQVRHWMLDEQQLHELVGLIQQGRIQVAPVSAPQPAAKPEPPR